MNFEIIETLNGFNHVIFEEKRHIYTIDGKPLISVTTLLKELYPDKDWDEIAYKYSLKHDIPLDEVKDKWAEEAKKGREKGSEFHLYAENAIANKKYTYNPEVMPKKLQDMWDAFWSTAKESLIPIKSEFITGDRDLMIGGMVDQLFWNIKMKEVQIWDWKTNKKIELSNKWNKLKAPVAHLDECEHIIYSLQVGIYKFIIEKNLGIKIGNCYIGHFHEDNDTFKIMKTREFAREVEQILQSR